MSYEPQKFFIGVVDLFSTLLPGAALVYLVAHSDFFREQMPFKIGDGPEGWLVFFFASYLIGHFLYSAGAKLDDWIYEPLTQATDIERIQTLSDGGSILRPFKQGLYGFLLGKVDDKSLTQVLRIKALASGPGARSVNAFQWSKARLSAKHAPGLAAVERLEADSKFFRSLMIALFLSALVLALQCALGPAVVCLALLPFALWLYANQRNKATRQAFSFVIALEDVRGPGDKPPNRSRDDPTHAGGVVYKGSGSNIKYLIVQAKKERAEWVLPKGHIEPGENPRQAAVREVREETGCWASIRAAIGTYRLGGDYAPLAHFYLMELASEDLEGNDEEEKRLRTQDRRRSKWLTPDQAKQEVSFPEAAQIINDADWLQRNP